jgi:hypothetical protein
MGTASAQEEVANREQILVEEYMPTGLLEEEAI